MVSHVVQRFWFCKPHPELWKKRVEKLKKNKGKIGIFTQNQILAK